MKNKELRTFESGRKKFNNNDKNDIKIAPFINSFEKYCVFDLKFFVIKNPNSEYKTNVDIDDIKRFSIFC